MGSAPDPRLRLYFDRSYLTSRTPILTLLPLNLNAKKKSAPTHVPLWPLLRLIILHRTQVTYWPLPTQWPVRDTNNPLKFEVEEVLSKSWSLTLLFIGATVAFPLRGSSTFYGSVRGVVGIPCCAGVDEGIREWAEMDVAELLSTARPWCVFVLPCFVSNSYCWRWCVAN